MILVPRETPLSMTVLDNMSGPRSTARWSCPPAPASITA